MLWDDDEQKPVKIKKSLREKLQEKLKKGGITNTEGVYLRIDRFLNPDAQGNDGMNGDKEFCWRGPCTIEYVTNDDYLGDTAKRHGAGNYWFTLRNQKTILAQWQIRIGGIPQTATTQADPMTGQSQIVYQPLPAQPSQNGTQSPTIPITKTLKEVAEIIEVVDRIRGDREPINIPQIPPEPQLSPEAQVLNLAAKSPGFIESVIDKFVDRGDREPSVTELIFKHGAELANAFGNMLQGVIRTAAEEFKQVRQTNGEYQQYVQNQMGTPQTAQTQAELARTGQMDNIQLRTNAYRQETSQQTGIQTPEENQTSIESGNFTNPNGAPVGTSPEDALLSLICDNCARQIPPQITAQRINEFADLIAEQAPHLSVDGWIDMFCAYDTETIINLASQGMFGEQGRQLAQTSHAQLWLVALRDILKEEQPETEGE